MNDHNYKPYVLFVCDPEKNHSCGKQGCHINGGLCKLTSEMEYAMQDKDGYLVGAMYYDHLDPDCTELVRAEPMKGFSKGSFNIRVIKAIKGGIQ